MRLKMRVSVKRVNEGECANESETTNEGEWGDDHETDK